MLCDPITDRTCHSSTNSFQDIKVISVLQTFEYFVIEKIYSRNSNAVLSKTVVVEMSLIDSYQRGISQ